MLTSEEFWFLLPQWLLALGALGGMVWVLRTMRKINRRTEEEVTVTERFVSVGGSPVKVNESEWVCASSPKGTMVRVTPRHPWRQVSKPMSGPAWQALGDAIHDEERERLRRPKVMELVSTSYYDGVSAVVREPDPDELIEYRIFPSMGDIVELA